MNLRNDYFKTFNMLMQNQFMLMIYCSSDSTLTLTIPVMFNLSLKSATIKASSMIDSCLIENRIDLFMILNVQLAKPIFPQQHATNKLLK